MFTNLRTLKKYYCDEQKKIHWENKSEEKKAGDITALSFPLLCKFNLADKMTLLDRLEISE